MIERMFEDLDDQALVAGIEVESRAESAAAARRLAFIAELASRRAAPSEDAVVSWACDDWDATAAEVGAAMNIGHRAASKEMRIAEALRERLPRVAALFARGAVSTRVVETLTWATHLVTSEQVLAIVDAQLAGRAREFGPMTVDGVKTAVASLVEKYDPAAVRRSREASRDRDVRFGKPDDVTGTVSISGRVNTADAVAYQKRSAHLTGGVCGQDPRTAGQRRADAFGVIAVQGDRLVCLCGDPQCRWAGVDPRAANAMVHIFAEPSVVDAKPDPYVHGDYASNPVPFVDPEYDPWPTYPAYPERDSTFSEPPSEPQWAPPEWWSEIPLPPEPGPEPEARPQPEPEPEPEPEARPQPEPGPEPASAPVSTPKPQPRIEPAAESWGGGGVNPLVVPPAPVVSPQRATAVIVGGGLVPASYVAQMIASGATVKQSRGPSQDPESGYRPSVGLAEFVRMRDLTCRFPGCDRPAECCDIDHTEPFPGGVTHASNTKCLCRFHHLIKTFWAGFVDTQLPDGRVVWTMPSGRTYTTVPGSWWVFPQWDTTTTALPPPPPRATSQARGVMMPQRKLTRAEQRARQIRAERARNQRYLSERNKPPPP
ncbi:HNH endonuclease [Mycolicibacterium smegmatis]|uniref:HNH endonuclease signature motif containing protein n=1 Tax=Mycolicibacterium smegmatis TaxID=1772 RepID=UPI001E525BB1|nr:HNH endonuclease signature motif containing protein [Mycolicibacterium smegmatis]MCP2628292.1 HNH endonuclease [Mycolicibacterium smegmatis]UGU33488.1 HNH endonuclease [Mycolicibacterium smegmatis]ULN68353.1 HNH endonuclease [Mycolicibacterium smegmatis]